ncbi:MAG: hypothetical protein GX989_08260 [Firmicutes bacterium]|nr:hypothetical protein [Bacillota bacterium]
MSLFNKVSTIILLAFLTVFALLFAVLPDKAFSEMENRVLQQRPLFSREDLFSGKFSLAAEKYLADQFAFRGMWVGIKSAAELVLQKKDNNGVYFGKDGYLLQKPEKLNTELLSENIAAINQFAAAHPARVSFLLAPSSVQILDDKLPAFAEPRPALALPALIKRQLSPAVRWIDPSRALAAHKREYIYYKTDHHWTARGAYYAYWEAGPALGFKPLESDDFIVEQVSDCFYGTLQAKSSYRPLQPDVIEVFKPKKETPCRVEYVHEKKLSKSLFVGKHLQRKDKYAFFLGGNHALLRVTAQNQTGRKLLLIKDSFANNFVPFLVSHYSEIHILDLRHFNLPLQPYIEQYGLDEILLVYNALSLAEDAAIRKISPATPGGGPRCCEDGTNNAEGSLQ